ncbi:hypothetical protein BIW11_02689 [Tropilaelaps mercedesae]|uniref:Uncharacterized protein n=1 Tax=Tropilaelaps mercedesae TaxID=418985 RepID=A0A1V9XYX1_9ACAR|nr:hypothetical protein BIW11_02689 [Tropilaelaps mercedesae]
MRFKELRGSNDIHSIIEREQFLGSPDWRPADVLGRVQHVSFVLVFLSYPRSLASHTDDVSSLHPFAAYSLVNRRLLQLPLSRPIVRAISLMPQIVFNLGSSDTTESFEG